MFPPWDKPVSLKCFLTLIFFNSFFLLYRYNPFWFLVIFVLLCVCISSFPYLSCIFVRLYVNCVIFLCCLLRIRSTCWLLKALWDALSRSPSSSSSVTRRPTWPSSSSCCWLHSTSPAPTCTCRVHRPPSWSGWFCRGCLVCARFPHNCLGCNYFVLVWPQRRSLFCCSFTALSYILKGYLWCNKCVCLVKQKP